MAEVKAKPALTPIDQKMKAFFDRETRRLKDEVEKMSDGPVKKMLLQELDLRERRTKQWGENPSGKPPEGLNEVTKYDIV